MAFVHTYSHSEPPSEASYPNFDNHFRGDDDATTQARVPRYLQFYRNEGTYFFGRPTSDVYVYPGENSRRTDSCNALAFLRDFVNLKDTRRAGRQ